MDLEEKLTATEVVFQGKYLRTEVQTIILPNGKSTTREVVSPPNAVGILAVEEADSDKPKIHLVRQYRSAIKMTTLEIPAGIIDEGEAPIETAKRECKEEIGMDPARLTPLCSFYHSVGFSTGTIQIFLADGLIPLDGLSLDAEEFLEIQILSLDAFYEKIEQGEIVDSKTIVAGLWYWKIKSIGK